MVVLSENWSIPKLDSPLQIGGIKLEQAHRVWLHPDNARAFDQLELAVQRDGFSDAEATVEYVHANGFIWRLFWQACLSGVFTVRAKRKSSKDEMSTYEFISTERVNAIWPHGFLIRNTDYDDIELYGPIPPWIKVTVDGQYYLAAFLVPEFQHVDDYSFVIMRGFKFELGVLQASVVRMLHQAVFDPQNWLYETKIQQEVQCGVISDLFKRHIHWSELIEKVGKGRYQLNLHSARGRPNAIFSQREDF
jgi:hypothetical protein